MVQIGLSEFRMVKESDWERECCKKYWGRSRNIFGGRGKGGATGSSGVEHKKKKKKRRASCKTLCKSGQVLISDLPPQTQICRNYQGLATGFGRVIKM